MGKIIKKDFLSFIIILVIFLLDQVSKYYVVNFFNDQYYEIFLTSFLNIQLIWNEGIAFGLLSFENRYYYNLISLIIFIVILILVFLMKSEEKFKYFYAMIVGGAIGNLIDRIRY